MTLNLFSLLNDLSQGFVLLLSYWHRQKIVMSNKTNGSCNSRGVEVVRVRREETIRSLFLVSAVQL